MVGSVRRSVGAARKSVGAARKSAGAVALAVCVAVFVAGSAAGCAVAREIALPAAPTAEAGAVSEAAHSVVRVRGYASSCRKRLEATGFVYAPERVLLNAHTVAGVDRDLEVVLDDGRRLAARVVAFDPEVDAAVLRVSGLATRPLRLTEAAITTAVVVGYRKGATVPAALPATVRPDQPAESYDIYNRVRVPRQVHRFHGAAITPGMSGAPLIAGENRVAGMVFAVDVDKADVGYALTAAQLRAVAAAGRRATATVPHDPCD
ncbi:trypsin-like peptidase domain-containing protein [Microbispora sp. H13382]|uniref:trypsin-like peptidase domain-containing protein n=1 Tax=Microbispora sp. H13382 TaxID=2729112 RepID=UPI001600DC34|nr:trypsin-like peptidase domain-containing protein [Microbispora sp. H13382]